MTATIEPLLRSPRLPALIEELQGVLAAERTRRERFYEALTEDTKAEFINGQVIMLPPHLGASNASRASTTGR